MASDEDLAKAKFVQMNMLADYIQCFKEPFSVEKTIGRVARPDLVVLC